MAKKSTTTKLTITEDPTAGVPAVMDFGEDSGSGFENQTQSDIAIPFLSVLQSLSPTVKSREHEAGMMYNTVTEEVFDGKEGISVIPVCTEHKFVEYVPRDAGGGFVAVHEVDSKVVEKAKAASTKFGKYSTESGNQLVETFSVYAIDAESGAYLVIPFTSTKIKQYKSWNTRINMFNHRAFGIPGKPPLFAHVVRLTTEEESRKGGDSFNFRLSPVNPERIIDGKKYPAILTSMIGPSDPRYIEAKGFLEMVKGGKATAAHETNTHVVAEEGSASTDSTKCPF